MNNQFSLFMIKTPFFFTVIFTAIILLAFPSCQRDDFVIKDGESKIVVEGWIEEGEVARVLLSRSIPMNEMVDSSSFLKYTIRSAMVIVSDDNDSDTLRLTSASKYLPPYLYVGNKITGQQGKKYKLTIRYLNQSLTAESVIPPLVPIKKVEYTHKNPNDTIGNLTVEFTDPADRQNYYQIATRVEGVDEIFVPCLYGNYNSRNFVSPDVRLQISRGITIFPKTNFEAHYYDGDRIFIRLRTMPKEGFDFWNIWQNEIVNVQNAVFPANSSLKSNINGGIGIWCGYGQSTVGIVAK